MSNVLPFEYKKISQSEPFITTFSSVGDQQREIAGMTGYVEAVVDSEIKSVNITSNKMPEVSREEIDAKLATVEARVETRFVELSGKLDRIGDAVASFHSSVEKNLSRLDGKFDQLRADLSNDNKFTRWTIAGIFVGSLLAALGALWVTQGNMLASFQTGISLHDMRGVAPK